MGEEDLKGHWKNYDVNVEKSAFILYSHDDYMMNIAQMQLSHMNFKITDAIKLLFFIYYYIFV